MIGNWAIALNTNGQFVVVRILAETMLGPFGTVREAEQAIDELVEAGNRGTLQ